MDLQALLERALAAADEGNWAGAAEVLRTHLKEFEDEPAVHCWLGVAEREMGMPGVAYERFKRALALDPEDPYVLATAGNAVAAFDDPDAEPALRAAALMAPELPLARMLYGAFLAREGMVEEALSELDAARGLDPNDAQIAYELGVARYLAGDVTGAAEAVEEAVDLDPADGWSRVVLGLLLLEEGGVEDSVSELVEGARLSPDDVEAQLASALALAASGDEGAALEMVERARLRALAGDLEALEEVEAVLDEGAEAAATCLAEDVGPDLLRRRVRERP